MPTHVVKANLDSSFCKRFPDDMILSVYELLKGEEGSLSRAGDDKAIIAMAGVCKDWQRVLGREGKEVATRLRRRIRLQDVHHQLVEREYPPEMIQLFKNANIPIWKLPVLDVENRISDYANFLKPVDMGQSVMRFKEWGRPGVAFHVEGYAEGQTTIYGSPVPIRDLVGVVAVFKRYKNSNEWIVRMSPNLCSMSLVHGEKHRASGSHVGDEFESCLNCPSVMRFGDDINCKYRALSNFLTGQDPLFRIAQGYTPYRPPLPAILPADNPLPPSDPAAPVVDNRPSHLQNAIPLPRR